jgi:hypothetical protein
MAMVLVVVLGFYRSERTFVRFHYQLGNVVRPTAASDVLICELINQYILIIVSHS